MSDEPAIRLDGADGFNAHDVPQVGDATGEALLCLGSGASPAPAVGQDAFQPWSANCQTEFIGKEVFPRKTFYRLAPARREGLTDAPENLLS